MRPESSRRGVPCRIAIRSRLSSRTGYKYPGGEVSHEAAMCAHAMGVADPYRGIRRQNQCCLLLADGPGTRPQPPSMVDDRTRARSLLSVGLQHRIACGRNLGTILLQARQNGEVTLINDRAAEALHVARTGLLLLRRALALRGDWLGEGPGGKRQ